jgi:20S proteasome subunit beta 1
VKELAHWMRQAVLAQRERDGQVSLLIAGYDPLLPSTPPTSSSTTSHHGRIFSVALSGALQEEDGDFAAAGSGSPFVLGYLDHELTLEKQSQHGLPLTETQAIKLCQRAIALAAYRDGSSGGLIRVCVINAQGTRYLDPVAVDQLVTSTETPSELLGFARRATEER